MSSAETDRQTRRHFLQQATAGTVAACVCASPSRAAEPELENENTLTFGLVTDVHYADADTRGTRHYRDSLAKLMAAVEEFQRQKVAFVAELGDLINAGPSK